MNKLEKIEEVSSGLNIIKFYADWCGPCRMFAPIMENVSQLTENVNFFSVNVDERRDLAAEFNIQSLPSIVVVKEGKVVDGFIGLRNAKAVTELINKYK
jgi:thioredoxin 1